jgi:hypothetical protein
VSQITRSAWASLARASLTLSLQARAKLRISQNWARYDCGRPKLGFGRATFEGALVLRFQAGFVCS